MDLATCTLTDFTPHVGQTFMLEAQVPLVLSAGHPGHARPGARAGFSLRFTGPREPPLEQRLYTLRHAELGELLLFLVPIAQDANGRTYEAVFT